MNVCNPKHLRCIRAAARVDDTPCYGGNGSGWIDIICMKMRDSMNKCE